MGNNATLHKIGLASLGILGALTLSAYLLPEKDKANSSKDEIILEELSQTKVSVEKEKNVVIELSAEEQKTVKLVNELMVRLEHQEKVDTMIQAEVESGYYTPENPLVILDPYSQSPLTALICFTTEQPTQVDIHIQGEDEYTEVNHSFSELTTQHVIPVYGLYPEKVNTVTVTVFDHDETVFSENICEIETEPVSDHFQSLIILTETFQDGYQEGINFLYQDGKVAFDKNGDIRWYFSKINYKLQTEYNYLDNHFLFAIGSGNQGTTLFWEIDKLGKIYSSYYSPYGLHHDITQTSADTFFALGYAPDGETIEDFIYEIDITNGSILNTLDMKYILQRNRPAWQPTSTAGATNLSDWLHMNSIEYYELDASVMISSNYQSCIVKMDWPSGGIHWILGNHDDWNPRMQQYLLTPIGDDFEWPYNQHAAMFLPDYDDNSETIDILLFDNGGSRFLQDAELQRQIRNNEVISPELYSRLVHYRINEVTMEVEQIWQYGKERGMQLYSKTQSDVDLLPNGNILGMFQHNSINVDHPVLSEVTKDSQLIWEAELFKNTETGNKDEYRAERLPFYFGDDAQHDIYTTANNLIPEEITKFVENYNNSQ